MISAMRRLRMLAKRPCRTRRFFTVSESVQSAIDAGRPVVALESTVVSHGMPFPRNLETARALEDVVRSAGCVPATVGIVRGALRVGLDSADLEALARAGPDNVAKASRRDLALIASNPSALGATTVSATMIAANRAGINVFVTGGIGGVHRGGESSMDVSADLTELGRTPVAVVCAGIKSILDIGRTLEVLETHGVPVITYGSSRDFPAFFTRKSGFESIANFETPEACADVIAAHHALKLNNGILFAVPIPKEHEFPDHEQLEAIIQDALREADRLNISGKDVTPFLLSKVNELTGGMSLESNIALIKNNALVGSQIAAAYAKQTASNSSAKNATKSANESVESVVRISNQINKNARPLIIGGTVVDMTSKFDSSVSEQSLARTSSPGIVYQELGGVGRNVAEACHRTGGNPVFVSVVGGDVFGQQAIKSLSKIGMDVDHVKPISNQNTAVYSAMLRSNGELLAAVADMNIHNRILDNNANDIKNLILSINPSVVCVDGNLSTYALHNVAEACLNTNTPLCFEPTSVVKSRRLFELPERLIRAVTMVTPDQDELVAMSTELNRIVPNTKGCLMETGNPSEPHVWNLMRVFDLVVAKLGPDGVMVGARNIRGGMDTIKSADVKINSINAIGEGTILLYDIKNSPVDPVSVTGAGDTLVGTMLASMAHHGIHLHQKLTKTDISKLVLPGLRGAKLSLMSSRAIAPNLSCDIFKDLDKKYLPEVPATDKTWISER